MEDRRIGSRRRLSGNCKGGSTGWAQGGRLYRSRAWLQRGKSYRVAHDSGKGTRFHRICGRSHLFLGPACCIARRQGCPRKSCRRNREQVHEMDTDFCRREKGVGSECEGRFRSDILNSRKLSPLRRQGHRAQQIPKLTTEGIVIRATDSATVLKSLMKSAAHLETNFTAGYVRPH